MSLANDYEMLSPGTENVSTRGRIHEYVLRRLSFTAHSNESSVGVDGDSDSDAKWEVQVITDSKIEPYRGFLYRVVWVGD